MPLRNAHKDTPSQTRQTGLCIIFIKNVATILYVHMNRYAHNSVIRL